MVQEGNKKRSRSFPGASLKECVGFIEKIDQELGTIPHDREEVANAIGYSASGGAGNVKIGAIVHFGLLINRNKKYALSESAETILRPISDHERTEEIKQAFSRPKLYSEILEKFQGDGRIPKQLPNILNRQMGVNSSSCKQAAKFFLESGEYAGVLDTEGHFIGSDMEMEEANSVHIESAPDPTLQAPKHEQANVPNPSTKAWTFPLVAGKTATVSISGEGISQGDIDMLIDFLDVYKKRLPTGKEGDMSQ